MQIKKCHTFSMSAGSMYHVNIDAKKIPLFISVWVGYWIRKNNLDSNKHEYPMDKQEQITCLAWPVGTPQLMVKPHVHCHIIKIMPQRKNLYNLEHQMKEEKLKTSLN